MNCYICDSRLGSDDIKYTPKYGRGNFAPCGYCQGIIAEVFEPLPEDELALDNIEITDFDEESS